MARVPTVILIAGPGGAGKTSTAARIAQVPGWAHVSEDDYWVRIKEGHPVGELRSADEQRVVQAQVQARLFELLAGGQNVVLEFILYESPPRPLLNYQTALAARGIPVHTRILRPKIDEVMRRMTQRGRTRDANVEKRRAEVAHQILCLASPDIQKDWVIDSTDLSLDEVYARYFRSIVES